MNSPYGRVSVCPTGAAIMSFRMNGHSDESAIGDLNDNCVDAGATEIQINLDLKNSREKSTLSIADNGCGMTAEQLAVALTLGPSGNRGTGDLGKFGLGMKFASISLGRRMEVLTRVDGKDLVKGTYDIDVICNPKTEWGALIEKVTDKKTLDEFQKAVGAHGTIIRISNLDMLSSSSKEEFHRRIVPRAGLTFHRLIEGSRLKIVVNGVDVRPMNPLEPEFESRLKANGYTGSRNYLREEFKIAGLPFTFESVVFEAEVAADLKAGSKRADAPWRDYFDIHPRQADAGVYILRNGRLIQHRPITDFGHASHPSQNYLRFVLSFGDELDGPFKIPNGKNSIEINQTLQDILAPHIKARAKYINGLFNSRKVKDEDKEIQDAEAEVLKAAARVERDKNLKRLKTRPSKKRTPGTRKPKTEKDENKRGPKPLVLRSQFAEPERAHLTKLGPLFQYGYDGQNRLQLILNVDHPFYAKFIGVEQTDKSMVTKLFDIFLFGFIYAAEAQAQHKEEVDGIMEEHLTEISRVTRLLTDAID